MTTSENSGGKWNALTLQNAFALRTSSASLAIKKPTVLATILTPRGLIMILVSFAKIKIVFDVHRFEVFSKIFATIFTDIFCLPISDFVSIARSNSFSFVKQRTDAWLKVIPTKDGERISVYISHPVPWKNWFSFSFYVIHEKSFKDILIFS